jgi:hypothetical protein
MANAKLLRQMGVHQDSVKRYTPWESKDDSDIIHTLRKD